VRAHIAPHTTSVRRPSAHDDSSSIAEWREHIMFASSFGRAALVGVVASSVAAAQDASSASRQGGIGAEWLRRSSFNLSAVQSRPQGVFGRNVGLGYGADGAYLLRLDDAGIWSLRASVGGVSYGSTSRRTSFSETVGDRVMVDVVTRHYIVPMSIGPQVSWPTGIVRPYANAGLGAQAFFTQSQVEGTSTELAIASTTNHSAATAAWTVGGGVYLPLRVGRTSVQLDFGAQYVGGGTARYLNAGSIVDRPDSHITVTPLESRTPMTVIRLGARVQP
jgi:hypothetical protein